MVTQVCTYIKIYWAAHLKLEHILYCMYVLPQFKQRQKLDLQIGRGIVVKASQLKSQELCKVKVKLIMLFVLK